MAVLESSYGIIPLLGDKVLLIQHASDKSWGFPKGHAEPEDSNEIESAKRELLEESGLTLESIDQDHQHSTTYFNPVSKKQKEVIYWVGTVKAGQELWTAHESLTYKEDQEMIEKVLIDMM